MRRACLLVLILCHRYLSSLLATVNYIGPLAGVFTFSGEVVVGADCNGFRPMCVTQFAANEVRERVSNGRIGALAAHNQLCML